MGMFEGGPPGTNWNRRIRRILDLVDTPKQYGTVGQGLVLDATGRELKWLTLAEVYAQLGQIVLYASTIVQYAPTDAGLAAAIAAAISGDVIEIPPSTYSNNYTVPAGVTVAGLSREDVVFSGQITLSNGSVLLRLTIDRSENDAGAIYGIVEGAGSITAALIDVVVDVANSTGPAYAVYMTNGGQIDAYNTELYAETGSAGYAVYTTGGDFYQYGGRALGKVALTPYFS